MIDRVSKTSPVTNLPDKVYEVYTTDLNNCRDSVLVNLVHNDGILPTVLTKNMTAYLNSSGSVTIFTSDINNGTFDNCSIDTLYLDKYTFNCSNTGANTVILTAQDINGNIKTKTATVTVLDTISPTITVQNTTITVDTSGNAYLLENMVVVTYNDNCSKDTITLSKNVFVVADKGVNNVNVTITDPSGNTVVKTVKVTVIIGDSDNDSIPDYIEKNFDTDSDGTLNYADVDSDNDGILDIVENDSNKTYQDFDGDGRPNCLDLDSDNDGINDVIEADVLDANGDGVKDNLTVFISNPNNQDLTGNPDYLDLDSDDDGLFDAYESKQNYTDSNKDGIIDGVDTDGDGILEFADGSGLYKDAFDVAPVDSDGDLIGDWRDKDSDGDKIPDAVELSADKDSDGMPNYLDRDSDNDSIPDAIEAGIDPNNPLNSDTDADPNYLDTDSDGDKILDNLEAGANPKSPVDTDSDAKPDYIDTDSDGDTILDAIEAGTDASNPLDTDNDGIYDFRETDSDNDGILDSVEVGSDSANPLDTDGDLLPDYRDLDSDADGISDKIETIADLDGDGKANYIDTDSDNDEILDIDEGTADTDGDGKPNYLDADVTIPEGFSPNSDGDNDLFVIKGLKVFTKAELTIFNRNGQIVFESGQGYANNWDGTNKGVNPSLGTTLPEGIYFYVFKFNGQNNQPITGNIYIKP
jgi:gliding motility-associated-like protein